jgi:hypothetical protein
MYLIQHYVIKFVTDLWMVSGFLWVVRLYDKLVQRDRYDKLTQRDRYDKELQIRYPME